MFKQQITRVCIIFQAQLAGFSTAWWGLVSFGEHCKDEVKKMGTISGYKSYTFNSLPIFFLFFSFLFFSFLFFSFLFFSFFSFLSFLFFSFLSFLFFLFFLFSFIFFLYFFFFFLPKMLSYNCLTVGRTWFTELSTFLRNSFLTTHLSLQIL